MLRIPFDPREQAPARVDDPGAWIHLRPHDHAFHAQQRLFRHLVRRRQSQPCRHAAEIALQFALVAQGLPAVAGIARGLSREQVVSQKRFAPLE